MINFRQVYDALNGMTGVSGEKVIGEHIKLGMNVWLVDCSLQVVAQLLLLIC